MTTRQFKKIARLLKEAYSHLEQEAIDAGVDILSPHYDELRDRARLAVLESNGFTLEEYREAKLKAAKLTQADMISELEIVEAKLDEIKKLHIPTAQDIRNIAHEVAKEYVVPPQITNELVERVVIERPIKETVTVREEYNDTFILDKVGSVEERLNKLKIPKIDINAIKSDIKADFGAMFKHNIDILGMPDFRKLAMGLRQDIDKNASDIAAIDSSVTLLDVSANSNTTAKSIYNLSAGVPVNFKSSDGNTIFYIDETTENVGIGTSSINSTAGITKIFEISGTIPGIRFDETDNATDWEIYQNAGNFNFWNGTVEVMTLLSGGNVGIGITTPSAKLHVIDTTEQLRLGYDATNYTTFHTNSVGDLAIIPSGADVNVTGIIRVPDSATGGVYVGSSADLLIYHDGTDSYIQNTTGRMIYYTDSATDTHNFFTNAVQRVVIGTATMTTTLPIISSASGGVFERVGSSTNQQYGRIGNTGTDLYWGVESSVAGAFFTNALAYAAVFYTNTNDIQILPAGQLGITVLGTNGYSGFGTKTPGAMVEVKGDIYIKSATADQGLYLFSSGNNADYSRIINPGVDSDSQLAFSVGAGEAIRILDNKNVGVRTTAPDKALEINSADGNNLRLTYNDADGSAANYTDFSVSSSGDLTIAPSGGDTNITGNLALGTGTLTLTGSIAATGARVTKGWFTDIESTNMPTVGGTSLSSTFAPIASPTFTGTVTLSTTTAGGVITLSENSSIALDPAGSADGKYTGITIAGTAGATLAFGDLVYLASADSRWELADADSATTADRMLGMCVLAAASDGDPTVLLLVGQIRADAAFPALTIGSPVYVGETAGDIQVAIPTGADNIIRRVGYALTADEIYFNPSMDSQVTVA